MPPLWSEATLLAVARPQARPESRRLPIEPAGLAPGAGHPRADPQVVMSLHISKLRGITGRDRGKLKRCGITYTHQLIEAAGDANQRWQLAARTEMDDVVLGRLVCRADLLRVKGIGAIFADMLELLGVDRIARLARQEPGELHRALARLNAAERFARRAPTPDEVRHWIAQAKALPERVEDEA